MAAIDRTEVDAGDPETTLYERTVDVDLLHITRMEHLEVRPPKGNGDS